MQQTAKRRLTRFLVITFTLSLFVLASGFVAVNFVFAQTAPVLQNDKLPEFIEWAKTYDIKLIGTKRSGQYIENNIWNSATDEIPLTAIGGINSVFEAFKKNPSHLINTLRGNAIFFSSGSDNCVNRAGFFLNQTELSQKYQKIFAELSQEAKKEVRRTYIPAGILPYMGDTYIYPYDMFLCMPGAATIHEFGHIVDLNGIRMFNGRETAIGKSDEETHQLYAEYERMFGVNKLSPEIRRQWQNSTSTMPGILNNYGLNGDDENFAVSFDYYVSRAQYFRDKAVQDPGVAEKYEFLKNKIFLGKEYFEEKSVVAAPAPVSTPTITTPTQTSSDQVEALKTQILQALQDQIAKLQAQLNEIQKTESKTTHTPVATPVQTNVFIKTLQRGIKDAEVIKLQEFLKQYPDIYPEGLVTGYFGPFTEAAVKRFQAKYGIESIGIVGPKTRQKLNERLSQKIKEVPTQTTLPTTSSTTTTPTVTPTPIAPVTTPTPTSSSMPTPIIPTPIKPQEEKNTNIAPQRIYPEEDIKQYATWEKINAALSDFGISAIFTDDNWKPIEPSLSEKEKMRESLMYFTYILDSKFKGTRISETLQEIKIAPANSVWSHIFFTVQISLRPENRNPDDYINNFIHEVGHGFQTYLARLDVKNNHNTDLFNEWNRICWPKVNGQIQKICNEREKSFVSEGLTIRKYEAQTAPQIYGYYYSDRWFSEDFAESFTAYVVSPNEFREMAQKYPKLFEKYEFLKTRIFLGKEY